MAKKIEIKMDMQAALADLLRHPNAEEVTPEWKTAREWQKISGRGKTTTVDKLSALVASGEWEMKMFAIPNRTGAVKPIPHYRKKP